MSYSTISAFDDAFTLSFDCGDLPADDAIQAAEHEPNGYFWEGIAEFIAPELVERIELDSEADMFSAAGERSDLEALQAKLEPLLASKDVVAAVINRAESQGFEFDD